MNYFTYTSHHSNDVDDDCYSNYNNHEHDLTMIQFIYFSEMIIIVTMNLMIFDEKDDDNDDDDNDIDTQKQRLHNLMKKYDCQSLL